MWKTAFKTFDVIWSAGTYDNVFEWKKDLFNLKANVNDK